MPIFTWSQTSSSNASADPTINYREGQAPSTINDSARAMMSAVAKYRDDIAGAIVTSGTATAYTVSSNSSFDTLAHLNGQVIAFSPHTTNGAGPVTLNVDGLGAKALRSAPNAELLSGTLIQGTPYVAVYNNTDGAFYLQGFYGNPYNVPLSAGMDYWGGTTAPNSSFAFPYGQAISRTTYATLFALMGTTYGTGDGSTTFNLPDKRGRASLGLDNMGGTAASRVTTAGSGVDGTTAGSTGGAETKMLLRSDLPNVAPTATFSGTSQTWDLNQTVTQTETSGVAGGSGQWWGGSQTATVTVTPSGTVAVQSLNGGVTQTKVNGLPPMIVVPYIIRII